MEGLGSIERDPFVFQPDFHKMQILNKLFIVWGGAKGRGGGGRAERGKATSTPPPQPGSERSGPHRPEEEPRRGGDSEGGRGSHPSCPAGALRPLPPRPVAAKSREPCPRAPHLRLGARRRPGAQQSGRPLGRVSSREPASPHALSRPPASLSPHPGSETLSMSRRAAGRSPRPPRSNWRSPGEGSRGLRDTWAREAGHKGAESQME